MQVTVVGLGKIGLPLAVQFASKGHEVFGVDINIETVNLVNQGIEPFPGEKDLAENLQKLVAAGKLKATCDFNLAVGRSSVVVVAVPLFITAEKQPDFSAIDMSTREIGKAVKTGTLVCYETTLPVGATRSRLAPILESESGLIEGVDLYVAFSPERVLTGRVFEDLRRYPKLVGGVSKNSEEAAVAFYKTVLDFDGRDDLPRENGVWSLGSSEAAELAKLAETTYRDVNIGLANQFALQAEILKVNIYEVIEACNSQLFSHIHAPGIAVGGHCIPVYPHLYLEGDPTASVVRSAREANKAMPLHVLNRVDEFLGGLQDKKVAILGLSYRGGVKEHAFSGAWDLINGLRDRKARPLVHDPLYSDGDLVSLGLESFKFGDLCDAVIIQADHATYQRLSKSDFPSARFLVDGRNITNPSLRSSIHTYVIGVGQ